MLVPLIYMDGGFAMLFRNLGIRKGDEFAHILFSCNMLA